MPDAVTILRLSSNGNLISETAVPAQAQMTRSVMFASSGADTHTGLALANPMSQDIRITLTPFGKNGEIVAAAKTMTLSALSQTSAFLDQLIGGLPADFEGFVLLDAAAPVYAISIRGTTNRKGGFLMSTMPIVNLDQMPANARYFPHFANGDWYRTEFLLMSSGASAPQLSLFGTDGEPLAIPLQ